MINIVLVEPKGEENIGAVSRAMMNMNVKNLILINPQCNYLSDKSLNYAIHSKSILENAITFPDFKSCLSISDLNIAITRRTGNWRRKDISISDLSEFLKDYENKKVSLIFGREANGLTNEEIMDCDLLCSISSSQDFPSLNLSHAVILTCYEIYKNKNLDKNKKTLASRNDFDLMINKIYETFEELEFFKKPDQNILKNYIRKILIRAKLEKFDVKFIKNIFESVKGIIQKNKKKL